MVENKRQENGLIMFEDREVRRVMYNDEWHFSVVDVVAVLTESINPTDYLKKLRKRDLELGNYIGTNCPQVEMLTSTGKKRKTLAGNTKNILRIIQSIPSKKAEPFKLWLAKVGYERIQEIENPELAQKRIREIYRAKGYSEEWIEKRIHGIAVRDELTSEWQKRGVKQGKEYAILTAEISKATFGVTPKQHKDLKGLEKKNQNLRDHMTNMELILNMLGEASTTNIAKAKDAKGFTENKDAAKQGGEVAGIARTELEKRTKKQVVSKENYLIEPEKKKLCKVRSKGLKILKEF